MKVPLRLAGLAPGDRVALIGNGRQRTYKELSDWTNRIARTLVEIHGQHDDRAIVDLGARAFSPGQTYVALSRIRSLDGLYLSRPLRPSDILVDADVRRFMAGVRAAGF